MAKTLQGNQLNCEHWLNKLYNTSWSCCICWFKLLMSCSNKYAYVTQWALWYPLGISPPDTIQPPGIPGNSLILIGTPCIKKQEILLQLCRVKKSSQVSFTSKIKDHFPFRFMLWFPTLLSCSDNIPSVLIRASNMENHLLFLF